MIKATLTRPITASSAGRKSKTIAIQKHDENSSIGLSYIPSEDDIPLMEESRDIFNNIIEESEVIVKENESIPSIKSDFFVILRQTQKTFEVFVRQAMNYFQQQQTLHLTASSNQFVSSASCRMPVESFGKDWISLSKIIDAYKDSHPPPHAKQIQLKFQSMISALEIIIHSNKKRRYPSLSLSNCISTIRSLNEKLSDSIIELFMQPTFPNFKTDLRRSYIEDIESYKIIINDAFMNEFVQSGILLCDLNRIKSNILKDCRDISVLIKNSFEFPIQMISIQEQKNKLDQNLKEIFQKLSIPFAIIKPLKGAEVIQNEKKEFKTEEQIQDHSSDQKVEENFSTLLLFLNKIKPQLDITFTRNQQENMDNCVRRIREMKDQIYEQEQKIKELEKFIKDRENEYNEIQHILGERAKAYENKYSENAAALGKYISERKSDLSKIRSLEKVVSEMQNKIESYEKPGDPTILRNQIKDIVKRLSEESSTKIIEHDCDSILYQNLIDQIDNLINTPCAECKIKEEIINTAKYSIKSVIDTNADDFSILIGEILSYNNNMKALNIKLENDAKKSQEIIDDLFRHTVEETKDKNENQNIHHDKLNYVKNQINELVTLNRKLEQSKVDLIESVIGKLRSAINNLSTFFEISIPELPQEKMIEALINILLQQKDKIVDQINNNREQQNNLIKELSQKDNFIRDVAESLKNAFELENNDKPEEIINVAISKIEDVQAPLHNHINELKAKLSNLKSDTSMLYTRLKIFDPSSNSDDQFAEMHKIISEVTDRIERTDQILNSNLVLNEHFRTAIESSIIELSRYLKEPNFTYQDDFVLIQYLQELVGKACAPASSNIYIERNTIDSVLKPVQEYFLEMRPQDSIDTLHFLVSDYKSIKDMAKSLSPSISLLSKIIKEIGTKINSQNKLASIMEYMPRIKSSIEDSITSSAIPEFTKVMLYLIAVCEYIAGNC